MAFLLGDDKDGLLVASPPRVAAPEGAGKNPDIVLWAVDGGSGTLGERAVGIGARSELSPYTL